MCCTFQTRNNLWRSPQEYIYTTLNIRWDNLSTYDAGARQGARALPRRWDSRLWAPAPPPTLHVSPPQSAGTAVPWAPWRGCTLPTPTSPTASVYSSASACCWYAPVDNKSSVSIFVNTMIRHEKLITGSDSFENQSASF